MRHPVPGQNDVPNLADLGRIEEKDQAGRAALDHLYGRFFVFDELDQAFLLRGRVRNSHRLFQNCFLENRDIQGVQRLGARSGRGRFKFQQMKGLLAFSAHPKGGCGPALFLHLLEKFFPDRRLRGVVELQMAHLKRPAQPLLQGFQVARQRVHDDAVNRQQRDSGILHVRTEDKGGIIGLGSRRMIALPHLVPKGQGGFIPVMTVRNEKRLFLQCVAYGGQRRWRKDPPEPVADLLLAHEAHERMGLIHGSLQRGHNRSCGIGIDHEDRTGVGVARVQEAKTVLFGLREGKFVREDLSLPDFFQLDQREKSLQRLFFLVRQRVIKFVQIQRRLRILFEHALFDPVFQECGRAGVTVVRGSVVGTLLAQLNPNDVVFMAAVITILRLWIDHIIRRTDRLAQILNLVGVITHALERMQNSHRNSFRVGFCSTIPLHVKSVNRTVRIGKDARFFFCRPDLLFRGVNPFQIRQQQTSFRTLDDQNSESLRIQISACGRHRLCENIHRTLNFVQLR